MSWKDTIKKAEPIEETKSSWRDTIQPISEQPVEEIDTGETSALEALALGTGEGASFGLTPILGGVASAAGEAIEDVGDVLGLTTSGQLEQQGFNVQDDKEGLQGLIDAYYEGRDQQIKAQEKAFEDQPGAYVGGLLGGGFTGVGTAGAVAKAASKGGKLAQTASKLLPSIESTKGLGTLQKVAAGTGEGLKAGAIAGFGGGEGRLLEGEVAKTAGDVAKTALGGAIVGGGLSTLGAGLSKGVDAAKKSKLGQYLETAYKYGKKGKVLTEKQVIKDRKKLSKMIYTRLALKNKKYGAKSDEIKRLAQMTADEVGQGESLVNAFEKADNKIKEIKRINDSDFQKVKEAALDTLAELQGSPKELKKIQQQVEKTRLTKMMKDVEDEVSIRLQKQSDIESIKRGQSPEIVKERIEKSADPKRRGLKYKVRDEEYYDVTKEKFPEKDSVTTPEGKTLDDLSDKDVIVKKYNKKRVSDATPFEPTEVVEGIDPQTGRPFAAYKDKGTGKIYGKIGDPTETQLENIKNATADDLQSLIESLNKKAKAFPGTPSESGVLAKNEKIQNITKKLAKELREIQEIMTTIEGYETGQDLDLNTVNKTLTEIKNTLDYAGIDSTPLDAKTNIIKDNIDNLQMLMASGGEKSNIIRGRFIENLKLADPTYGKKLSGFIDEINSLTKLVKAPEVQSGESIKGLIRETAGGPTRILARGANIAGRVNKGINQNMVLGQRVLKDLSPVGYDFLAETIEKAGRSDFANVLRSIKNENQTRKNALLYSLYQQKDFRQMLQDMGEYLSTDEE